LTTEQANLLNQAFRLLQEDKAADAQNAVRRILAAAPQSADAHHLLALCCKALNDDAAAEQAFTAAARLAPRNPHILGNFANWLKSRDRFEDALGYYRRAVEIAPDFDQGWLNMGIAALAAGKSDLAFSAITRAIELRPQSSPAWEALGGAHRRSGDLNGAEAAFRKATALDASNAKAWVNLGVVLRLLGRPAEALPCLDEARRRGYATLELSDSRAGVLIDLGELQAAFEELRRLIEAAPQFAQAQVTRAHLLWEYGELLAPGEDPLTGFRLAVADQPNNEALRFEYVRFLLHARRSEEALDLIRRRRENRDRPTLAMCEAHALINLGRLEEAGAIFERLDEAGSKPNVAFLNAYTHYLLRAGQWDAAARRAQEATEINPEDQEAWCHLATAWRLIDDPREYWLCDYDRIIGVVDVEPPPQFADSEGFIAALKTTLEPLHQARREPVNQSLRGGSQTPGRLFGRPDPVIEATRQAIVRAVERHIATLPDDETHPFLRRKKRSVSFTGSWSVKLWTSGKHANHFHPEGWMSSAYYVSLPPSVTDQSLARDPHSGWIQFGQPQAELNLDLAPRRYVRPKAGQVALFPSYMWHGTVPFEDDEPRMTVAFDMTPVD
jgi:uncharacterized protein (TIGR02466 family)